MTATVNAVGDACDIVIGHDSLMRLSWVFSRSSTEFMPPLAKALLASPLMQSVWIVGRAIRLVAAYCLSPDDWRTLLANMAPAIRGHINDTCSAITNHLAARVPGEEEIRQLLDEAIRTEIAPVLEKHGGRLDIVAVEGNTVFVTMGGGCQGCAAASFTLRGDVDHIFRKVVPLLGVLVDSTDHESGRAPYFQTTNEA